MVRVLTMSDFMGILYGWDVKAAVAAVLVALIVAAYAIRPRIQKPDHIRNVDRTMIASIVLLGLIVYLRVLELNEYWG